MSIFENLGGKPRELYTFARGSDMWRYTSANKKVSVTYGMVTLDYSPALIVRDKWARTTPDTSGVFHLKIARVTPIVAEILKNRTTPMYVGVHRHQADGGTPARICYGYAGNITLNGNWVELDVITGEDAPWAFPPLLMSKNCIWAFGSHECGVSEDLFTTDAVIDTIVGSTITAVSLGGAADGYFTLGRIKFPATSDQVTITSHVGLVLKILGPVPDDVSPGDSIKVVAGCDKSIDACVGKFANGFHYGGFPFIPIQNPLSGTLKI